MLEKLVNLGHKDNQLDFMVTTTCNGIPPAYFTLQKMEKLLGQAYKLAEGIALDKKEKVLNMGELTK